MHLRTLISFSALASGKHKLSFQTERVKKQIPIGEGRNNGGPQTVSAKGLSIQNQGMGQERPFGGLLGTESSCCSP